MGRTAASPAPEGAYVAYSVGRVSISTGCNTGSAEIEVTDDTITFGSMALTRMACVGDVMAFETAVVDAAADGVREFEEHERREQDDHDDQDDRCPPGARARRKGLTAHVVRGVDDEHVGVLELLRQGVPRPLGEEGVAGRENGLMFAASDTMMFTGDPVSANIEPACAAKASGISNREAGCRVRTAVTTTTGRSAATAPFTLISAVSAAHANIISTSSRR